MKNELITQVRERHELPLIGVIGSTRPTKEYKANDGIVTGYVLRGLVEKKGTIVTGGVEGVGLDIYRGVVKYCVDSKINELELNQKFFALIPHNYIYIDNRMFEPEPEVIHYNLPREYNKISQSIFKENVLEERMGFDMDERREYLANTLDIAIMLNGSFGTLDEALHILRQEKKVIALENTGGAAKFIKLIKSGKIQPNSKIAKNIYQMGHDIDSLNKDNIILLDSTEHIEQTLNKYLS